MKKSIFLLFLVMIYGCDSGVEWKKETTNFNCDKEQIIQLLPGMKFTTIRYYWSNSGTTIGKLKQSPTMAWLDFPLTIITSYGCSNVIPVLFPMEVPGAFGDYSAKIIDGNNRWVDLKITMRVTDNPTENINVHNVTINQNDSFHYIDQITYSGLDVSSWNNNCVSNPYFPSNSQKIEYEKYQDFNWIKIEPLISYLSPNETKSTKISFYYYKPGIYKIYIIKKLEWEKSPHYILFNITMN